MVTGFVCVCPPDPYGKYSVPVFVAGGPKVNSRVFMILRYARHDRIASAPEKRTTAAVYDGRQRCTSQVYALRLVVNETNI